MFGTSWIARRNFSQICLQWYTDLLKPCLALKQNEFPEFYLWPNNELLIYSWMVGFGSSLSFQHPYCEQVGGQHLGPDDFVKDFGGIKTRVAMLGSGFNIWSASMEFSKWIMKSSLAAAALDSPSETCRPPVANCMHPGLACPDPRGLPAAAWYSPLYILFKHGRIRSP